MANYVDLGKDIGQRLKNDGVKTSQIRKFLSAVNSVANKIQNEGEQLNQALADEIQYLRVKLAYQAGREDIKRVQGDVSEYGLHYLQKVLDLAIGRIGNSKSEFEKFNKLVETIVAYHKFYGGED
jgi:CRISPR type III-A-associated protein Csm2